MTNTSRRTLAVTMATLLATAAGSVHSATGEVACTIFVGGNASDTQSFRLDENGSGTQRMTFEANMFTARVDVNATAGQVQADMTLTREGGQQVTSNRSFGRLRASLPEPASREITVSTARLRCDAK